MPARQRAPRGKRAGLLRLPQLNGGEASIYPPQQWPIKFSALMQNCWINERNNIAKIPGYSKVNAVPVGSYLDAGHEFVKTNGDKHILVSGDGSIYRLNQATNEFGNANKTGLDPGICQYTTFSDRCIVSNGSNSPLKTLDGITFDLLGGNPPTTTFKTHAHKGRIWFLERADKMLASHSALNDPDTQEGFIDFRYVLKKGDELVDSFTYIDLHVFLFKNHVAIYSGSTPSDALNTNNIDYQLIQLIEGVQVIGTGTAQGLGNDTPFLTKDGVKTFKQIIATGSLNVNDLSYGIDSDLKQSIDNPSELASAHYPRLGWYLLKIDETIRIFDYVKNTWSRIVGADCNGMFTTQDGKLYFVGNAGYLYEYGIPGVWGFAGVDPEFIWRLGWLSLSRSGTKVSPKFIELLAYCTEAVTLEMATAYDLGNAMTNSTFDIALTPSGITQVDAAADFDAIDPFDEIMFQQYRNMLFGRGRMMQMQFSNTSDKYIELADIVLQTIEGGF